MFRLVTAKKGLYGERILTFLQELLVGALLIGQDRYVRPLFARLEFRHYDEIRKSVLLHEVRHAAGMKASGNAGGYLFTRCPHRLDRICEHYIISLLRYLVELDRSIFIAEYYIEVVGALEDKAVLLIAFSYEFGKPFPVKIAFIIYNKIKVAVR